MENGLFCQFGTMVSILRARTIIVLCACKVASVVSDSLRPPWTVACQAPLSIGFSRKEYWSGLPCPPPPGSLPDPGIEPRSPTLQADSLPAEPPGKSPVKIDFPHSSVGKETFCNAGDPGSIPRGRSPGEGIGYPLQYSGLENSMDCRVHGVSKSRTWPSNFHFQKL